MSRILKQMALPKVYRISLATKDGRITPCYSVATSMQSALKQLLAMDALSKSEDRAVQYTWLEESWFANILVLIVPRYKYTSPNKWSDWIQLP